MADLHDKSEDSWIELKRILPNARKPSSSDGQFYLNSDMTEGPFRLKAASKNTANQVHVGLGETIVAHKPNQTNGDLWYVIPVRKQIELAILPNAKSQHSIHALDCMTINVSRLDSTDAKDIEQAFIDSLHDNRSSSIKNALKIITNTRDKIEQTYTIATDIIRGLDEFKIKY